MSLLKSWNHRLAPVLLLLFVLSNCSIFCNNMSHSLSLTVAPAFGFWMLCFSFSGFRLRFTKHFEGFGFAKILKHIRINVLQPDRFSLPRFVIGLSSGCWGWLWETGEQLLRWTIMYLSACAIIDHWSCQVMLSLSDINKWLSSNKPIFTLIQDRFIKNNELRRFFIPFFGYIEIIPLRSLIIFNWRCLDWTLYFEW